MTAHPFSYAGERPGNRRKPPAAFGKGTLAVSLPSLDQAAFRRRLGRAVAVPAIALIVLALMLLALLVYLQGTMRRVSHSDEALAQASHLEQLLIERETSVRGYLVAAGPSF